jgi:hypothetical protein
MQVMALLAYLYEFKQNYGPHLIIVPNAVIVNWKAELHTWLPDFRCVYYTGSKDERAVKFQQASFVSHACMTVTQSNSSYTKQLYKLLGHTPCTDQLLSDELLGAASTAVPCTTTGLCLADVWWCSWCLLVLCPPIRRCKACSSTSW